MAIRNNFGKVSVELEIGDWDMDATDFVTIPHGLSSTEWKTIRNVQAIIRSDDDLSYYNLTTQQNSVDGTCTGAINVIDSTNIGLIRTRTYEFDNTFFDSTSYNRGWVTFEYTPD